MVVFVGDCPSRLNKDPDVAFIGSKSETVLMDWIKKIGPKESFLINSHTEALVRVVSDYYSHGEAIVALGQRASDRLTKAGIPHFKLSHPSPRNRLNNDKKFVDDQIKRCQNYLKGLGKCV